jgi:hypothetical protein
MHAQFIVLPALTKIQEFFVKATGAPSFHAGAEWFTWLPLTAADIEAFRRYIRPSHTALLTAAAAQPTDGSRVCAFLRQLLRPYKFKIETKIQRSVSSWVLLSTDTEVTPVGIHAGVTVTW